MQRIFLSPEQFQDETALITGMEHQHLARVLRARVGEKVVLLDGMGNAFHAVLVSIEKNQTTARLEEAVSLPPEPSVHLTIAQALGKGDKFEQVIQHGTEAGASAFVPVRAERCVVDIPAAKTAEKVTRWQQIAKSAAEQSGRAKIPAVAAPVTSKQLLSQGIIQPGIVENMEVGAVLLLHPVESALPLSEALKRFEATPRLILAIGPEGGWSPTEVTQAQAANIPLVSLGPRILRTETAALVAISQILYHFENMRQETTAAPI